MKGKVLALTLFILLNGYVGNAQQPMNAYSFVEVPEMFEFLSSKDHHQLNSLTKFLFNKYGFNAYFGPELPNVRKCDGLYADVEGKPGFIYTRITVVVRDCNGNELFRSAEGKSKLKEYKKAYHEALREAFMSFDGLGVSQPEIVLSDTSVVEKPKVGAIQVNEATQEPQKATTVEASGMNLPVARFSSYTYKGEYYVLRKLKEGFSLSKEVQGAANDLVVLGMLTKKGDQLIYTDESGDSSKASFDQQQNLTLNLPTGALTYVLVRN